MHIEEPAVQDASQLGQLEKDEAGETAQSATKQRREQRRAGRKRKTDIMAYFKTGSVIPAGRTTIQEENSTPTTTKMQKNSYQPGMSVNQLKNLKGAAVALARKTQQPL
ncbi:hypothetical protein NDU88_000598 [Pleurodeles waltl]|uniref:Uncharacterized protein n=1 Tax=Pleurodeles waltl TaxID=8319 RepID=A0AAV7SXH0_PLEWA|nr:hypothetical protein NDU88_000598 [Pleurodeles waltl]